MLSFFLHFNVNKLSRQVYIWAISLLTIFSFIDISVIFYFYFMKVKFICQLIDNFGVMETNQCFICGMPCLAVDKYIGLNIASTLTMPLSAVLEKCLRVVAVDVDDNFFCLTCTERIEEYDRLIWHSRRIEKELHEQFQNKCMKFDQESTFSNEIIWDRDRVNEVLIRTAAEDSFIEINSKLNIDNESKQEFASDNESIKIRNRSKSKIKSENSENITHISKPLIEESKKLHYTIQSVSCDYCGRTYQSKGALSVHIVKHIEKCPHECEICEKTFTQRGGLVRHMRIHNNEQPHQCEICGKQFIHTASFNMHKKIHVDERSKRCTICGSEFRSSSHITRHMRTHTGEKPFACPICGQKFAQRYNLKTHQKTHEKEQGEALKNYKCLICSQAFNRREKLNEHLIQAHQAIETSIPLKV